MGGFSRATGLEIFTQANDLQISIPQNSEGKHAVLFSRGPGHNFKPLLSTEPQFEKGEAISVVRETLEFICEKSGEELGSRSNIVTQVVNPDGLSVEEMKNVLTEERIERILDDLQQEGVSNTFEHDAVPSG